MRVVVAPSGFSGAVGAVEAASAVARGWARVDPAGSLDLAPMSDGGPGFVAAVAASTPGRLVEVAGGTIWFAVDGTAFVEPRSPEVGEAAAPRATGPVGELLAAALGEDPLSVVVGAAHHPSTDAGAGCVERFLALVPAGWPAGVRLLVATDAANPLAGELPDSLGYGLVRIGGARVSGVQTMIDAIGLGDRAAACDLLLTGEAMFDGRSLEGGVPRAVAWVAQRAARPCVVLAGRVMVGRREYAAAGIDAAYAADERPPAAGGDVADAGGQLADLAERVARTWVPRH